MLAKIEGRGKADPKRRAVVLRADIDALPIDERNDADWSSRNQGVMHACGHDMHAAVLFGVLQQLAAEPDFRGTIFGTGKCRYCRVYRKHNLYNDTCYQ